MVKKPEEKPAKISVLIPQTLREAIEAAAKDDGRNLSSMVARILTDYARASGYLKK